MLALILLPALFSSGAFALETIGLPDAARRDLARLERGFDLRREGRLLSAESGHVTRRAGKIPDAAILYQRGPAALVFDVEKISREPDWEFEPEFARCASLASQGLPFDLVEGEEKARADELSFVLERAKGDKPFAAKFRAVLRAGEAALRAEKATGLPALRPAGALEALGLDAARLRDSVDDFSGAVEAAELANPEAVTRTALADFIERYGPEFAGISPAENAAFARAGEKRYPAALLRAARSAVKFGGLPAVDEAVGPVETRTLPELRRRLEKFK